MKIKGLFDFRRFLLKINSVTNMHTRYSQNRTLFSLWLHNENTLTQSAFLPPNPVKSLKTLSFRTGDFPWRNNPTKYNEIFGDNNFHAAYVYSPEGYVCKRTIFQFPLGKILYTSHITCERMSEVITIFSLDK